MADVHDKATRSKNMRAIGTRDTAIEKRLAGLLAAYAVQRPAMLAAWRAGQDTDGHGRALDADLLW